MNDESLTELCEKLLLAVGEDPSREGLVDTPTRVTRAIRELTEGYSLTWQQVVGDAIYHEPSEQMIAVKGIEFFSLCEHHLLPFFGRVNLAYIPSGKILGLSKIPRIVQLFARRLQLQERLGDQISDAVIEAVQPLGVMCQITAAHLCVRMRGVENSSAEMTTLVSRGSFKESSSLRSEALLLWQQNQ